MEDAQVSTKQIEGEIADLIMGDEPEELPEPEGPAAEGDDEQPEAKDETEDGDEPEESDAEEQPEYVEMEIDGKLYEVPAELKDSVLRQSDYTKKTQDVAEQRKQVEVRLEEVERTKAQYDFAQEVQPDMAKIQALETQAEQLKTYLKENLDSLTAVDIEKVRMAIGDAKDEREKIALELQGKTQAFQQAQEQSRAELLKKGTEVLRSRIPGWGAEHAKQVSEFALATGYTEQEVNSIIDPRHALVLWKAAQYEALQNGKTAAVKRVQGAPPIKPKSRNPMPQAKRSELDLRKKLSSAKLSDKDKARLIEADIGERWS